MGDFCRRTTQTRRSCWVRVNQEKSEVAVDGAEGSGGGSRIAHLLAAVLWNAYLQ